MNSTIDYYNRNAAEYFERTADVEIGELYEKFLQYVPESGRIMDLGCGSGRDVKWFRDHGFDAHGLDASEELAAKAGEYSGVPVETGLIEDWFADEPFDGIWCCAALMHIDDAGCRKFFKNLQHNLRPDGILYISVKTDIETGFDEVGRFFRNFTEEDMHELADSVPGLTIKELWYTQDSLSRTDFRWLNAIIKRKYVFINNSCKINS